MVDGGSLEDEIQSRPPVCLIHGDMDDVVPHAALGLASEMLEHNDVPHEAHSRPNLAHGIDQGGIALAAEFLKKVL
jgi:phospholipase/carboxylesterase